jgi:hypothetical protein
LVWIEGPYPAGKFSDIIIFRQTLIHHLDPFERVVADDGYIGEARRRVKAPGLRMDSSEDRAMQSVVRSRHTTLNGWFKFWETLKQPLRHTGRFFGPLWLSYNLVSMRVTSSFR